MPRKERTGADAAYLVDMQDACKKIARFIAGMSEGEFTGSELVRSAVERQVEIIGEAARNLSKGFREAYPEVPWRPIMAQRHILAHEYGEVEPPLIYRVATVHVPALLAQITPLVSDEPRGRAGR